KPPGPQLPVVRRAQRRAKQQIELCLIRSRIEKPGNRDTVEQQVESVHPLPPDRMGSILGCVGAVLRPLWRGAWFRPPGPDSDAAAKAASAAAIRGRRAPHRNAH